MKSQIDEVRVLSAWGEEIPSKAVILPLVTGKIDIPEVSSRRLGVLFLQSQSFFGADSAIHATLMRRLDRSQVQVHVACTTERMADSAVSAPDQLATIRGISLRHTDFGTSASRKTALTYLIGVLNQGGRFACSLFAVAGYIRRHHIQVIHATEKPRDCVFGVLLSALTGAKLVLHLHVRYAKTLKPSVRWASHHADAIIGVSQFVADTIVAAGLPEERVFSVPNSLDRHFPTAAQWFPRDDSSAVRKEFGIPAEAFVLGTVSRLFQFKGHIDMLLALSSIHDQLPSWRWVIVGEDDPRAHPGGGSYRSELEQMATRIGLRTNLIFTGFRTDIPRLMSTFDLYAMPSFEEPFGMVFLEAMAMKKPVVAYQSGGVSEVVSVDSGILVPEGDWKALGEAIVHLVNHPSLRAQLGITGEQRVSTHFTPKQQCEKVLAIYQTLTQKRADSRFKGEQFSSQQKAKDRHQCTYPS